MKRSYLFLSIVGMLVLAGCSQVEIQKDNSLELTQTHVFSDFGFSIDYPEDWFAETRDTVTTISEKEKDQTSNFGGDREVIGYQIVLDHVDINFLSRFGLPSNPSLDDLLQFNTQEFKWQDTQVTQSEVFGVPAIRSRHHVNTKYSYEYMGFLNGEVFLFGLAAPSEQLLDEISPTWEKMVESIEPVDE